MDRSYLFIVSPYYSRPSFAGKILVFFLLIFLGQMNQLKADDLRGVEFLVVNSDIEPIPSETIGADLSDSDRPNPVFFKFKHKQRKNKRITAAILAFPLPFGIVGLHRIYLGTAPHVPVIYIGTAGGVFGILPFIDFCVLVLDKDISRYQNNKKVFMWVAEE